MNVFVLFTEFDKHGEEWRKNNDILELDSLPKNKDELRKIESFLKDNYYCWSVRIDNLVILSK